MTDQRGIRAPRVMPAHLMVVVVTVALCAAYAAASGWSRSLVLVLASGAPAMFVLGRLVRSGFPRPQPWWCLAGGLTALTVHSSAWLVEVGADGAAVPHSLVAAWSLPLGYALLLVGAVLLLVPFAGEDGSELLEAAALWLASASLLWVMLVHPALVRQEAAPSLRLYTLTVLLLVSGIAGMVLRTAIVHPGARAALLYMSASVALTLLGNVARELTRATADGPSATWVGMIWILAYGGIGAGALHPSHVELTPQERVVPHRSVRLSTARLWAFGLAVGLNPVLAGLQKAVAGDVDWMLLTLSTLAIVPLVVVRIARLAVRGERAEQALAYLASHDELTGLPNRRAATAHLTTALAQLTARRAPGVTVAFLDVDDLKLVNDTHGHAAGDTVIRTIGERVTAATDGRAFVSRFGGDEFVLVATSTPEQAEVLRAELRTALAGQVETAPGHWARASASMGVRHVRPGEAVTAQQVLADADELMYAAKRTRAAS